MGKMGERHSGDASNNSQHSRKKRTREKGQGEVNAKTALAAARDRVDRKHGNAIKHGVVDRDALVQEKLISLEEEAKAFEQILEEEAGAVGTSETLGLGAAGAVLLKPSKSAKSEDVDENAAFAKVFEDEVGAVSETM